MKRTEAMAKRLLLVLGALLVVVLGGVAGAGPASAHAALLRSDPRDGSVVKAAPTRVRLWFSEGVLMSADSIKVLEPDGRRADSGDTGHIGSDSATASVGLRSGLADGTYVVTWKAVSADTHPVSGAFAFSIGSPSRTSVNVARARQTGGAVAGVLYGIGRYVSYAGYALLVGVCVFLTVCWPRGARLRPMRRLTMTAWVMLVAGTVALLMLRGPYEGGGLGQAFDLGVIRTELATKPGVTLVSRLLLLTAAAVLISVLFRSYAGEQADKGERRHLAWGLGIGGTVVATGLAATWALSEHASVGIQTGLAMPVDIVHLIAMAVWLGGLAALLTALTRGLGIERDAVLRFSRIAFSAVCALAATGLYQSWRQLGSFSALFGTAYGQLLLVKVALVALLLALARVSRRWTHRLGTTGGAITATTVAKPEKAAPMPEPEPVAAMAGSQAPGNDAVARETPERTAQLARQRAATAKAGARRERNADAERAGLRRSVLAEVVVAVAVLAVTTVLTGTQPGRTVAEQQRAAAPGAATSDSPGAAGQSVDVTLPFDTGGENGKGEVRLTLAPARSGADKVLRLLVTGGDGVPHDVPEVRVAFTLGAKKIGPIRVALSKVGTGRWSADNVTLPIDGTWTASVTVRTSDIDEITETKNVEISQ